MKNKLQVKQINVDGANKFALIFDSIDELLDTVYTLGKKESKKESKKAISKKPRLNLMKGVDKQSKLRGVSWNKQHGAYKARITLDGVKHYLGSFDNEIDAHNAYEKARADFYYTIKD